MRVAVFASGSGSNFQAISNAYKNKDIPGQLVCLFCDQTDAFVIERAKEENIPYFVLVKGKEQAKVDYEKQIVQILEEARIDLIVLAGYMKILGNTLLKAYPNRIINLHPSLLPKFKGANGIEEAYLSNEKKTGISIHLVDQGIDTGPIIFQKELLMNQGETLEELTDRIHQLEHQYYPKIIADFIRENIVK